MKLLFLVVTLLICVGTSFTQVLNYSQAVTDIQPGCRPRVTVDDSGPMMRVGTAVILIQMQDRDSVGFERVNNIAYRKGLAGLWIRARVESVNRRTYRLNTPFLDTFDVQGRVQIVQVFEAPSLIITEQLQFLSWNGRKGGVAAIDVDTAYFYGRLNLIGKGFRGGASSLLEKSSCNAFRDYASYSGGGYAKPGEGRSVLADADRAGQAPWMSGGGGGGGLKSGGAGGSNGNFGGHGGAGSGSCDNPTMEGTYGKSDIPNWQERNGMRLYLGGGGGGGNTHHKAEAGSQGDAGGGIALFWARLAISRAAENGIDVSGYNVATGAQDEGGGGGGAGGSIYCTIDSVNGEMSLTANGGMGHSTYGKYIAGPGGGGSGGYIGFTGLKPTNIFVRCSGGIAGSAYDPLNAVQLRVAAPGLNGVVDTFVRPPYLGDFQMIAVADTAIGRFETNLNRVQAILQIHNPYSYNISLTIQSTSLELSIATPMPIDLLPNNTTNIPVELYRERAGLYTVTLGYTDTGCGGKATSRVSWEVYDVSCPQTYLIPDTRVTMGDRVSVPITFNSYSAGWTPPKQWQANITIDGNCKLEQVTNGTFTTQNNTYSVSGNWTGGDTVTVLTMLTFLSADTLEQITVEELSWDNQNCDYTDTIIGNITLVLPCAGASRVVKIEQHPVTISTTGNSLKINGMYVGAALHVYSTDGRLVYNGFTEKNMNITLNRGLYILHINGMQKSMLVAVY